MDKCPICTEPFHTARVVCAGCGQELPLQVVVVSEGSQGGGFALVEEVIDAPNPDEQVRARKGKEESP